MIFSNIYPFLQISNHPFFILSKPTFLPLFFICPCGLPPLSKTNSAKVSNFSKVEIYSSPSFYLHFSFNLPPLFLRSLFVFCSSFVRNSFVIPSSFIRLYFICPCGSHRLLFVISLSGLCGSHRLSYKLLPN